MGVPEGVGGEGDEERGVNLPSAKKFFFAEMLLWDEEDVGFVLFHYVIYNSVGEIFIFIFWEYISGHIHYTVQYVQ